jgi:amino acid permease
VLNFAAVTVVFCSGLFGRYLYSFVPHTPDGEQIGTAQKIFQRWIVLHRPLATLMYILSIVHVVLSYMYAMAFTAE